MYFEFRQSLGTGDIALDGDIRALEIVHLDAGSFLVSATGGNGGLVSYRLGADGTAQGVAGTAYFSPDGQTTGIGIGTFGMETVAAGADGTVVLGGGAGTATLHYGLSGTGTLTGATAVPATGGGSTAVTAAQLNAGTVYYGVDANSGQVMRHMANGATPQQVVLDGVTAIDTVQIDGQSFLLAAQHGTSGISSYSINAATGALAAVDDLGAEQGLGISVPTAFETVTAFDQTWVVLGSAGSSTLSVLELDATGMLTAVDHVLDTRETRFGGVQSVGVAQVDDRVFVVAGGADDGLSLFTLMPDGRLIHLETIPHGLGDGLMNVGQIETAVIDDALQIFVSSSTDAGISRFSVDLSGLGITLRGDTTGADQLRGGAGDDMLVAGQGDTVTGGDGNDILVGARDARLTGGAGADIFVLSETGGTTRVLDFTPGVDVLDMSSYFMLRSLDQLSINSTSSGARIQFGDTLIEVSSSNGLSLDRDGLFGAFFDWADRIPILERTEAPAAPVIPPPVTSPPVTSPPVTSPPVTSPPAQGVLIRGGEGADTLTGSAGADTLSGGSGGDTISGFAGDDVLAGDSGDDLLAGGAGNDWISGGGGNDTLRGDAGEDTLGGGAGADDLDGGADDDVLRGGADNDRLAGGSGHDALLGEAGNDTLLGGWGNDTLTGADGNDLLYGGGGDDLMTGTAGNDTLFGEDGNDGVSGGTGNDALYGGAGDDVMWGGTGRDTMWGGGGNDMMGGSEDNDLMYGDSGNDTVWGGSQHDTLYGGEGNDTVGGFWGNDLGYGGEGNDSVWGNFGDDTLYGDNGNDMIGGAEGNDILVGGDGNDTLVGGDDTDELTGGNGNDLLTGGSGDDWLSGGGGADTFFFFYNHTGTDRIADFNPDVDLIAFDTRNASFGTLDMRQQGSDVVITLNRGQVTLVDTDLYDLDADNFAFG